MSHDDLSDEQILYLVGTTDKECFEEGMDIAKRDWEVPIRTMQKLGYMSFKILGISEPPIIKRIRKAFRSIYRTRDIAVGGHIGVFMYRDIFAGIGVPHVIGRATIQIFKCVDLTSAQLRIIQDEPKEMGIYIDQFSDVADIQYGCNEIKAEFASNETAVRFINLSRLHLHAAAAVLTGGYDYRGAVQAALLATELALKAGAAAHGLSEEEIRKKYGHNNKEIALLVGERWPSIDCQRILRVIAKQPSYVLNRYTDKQPTRREVGHLVMGAQYIVSEVVRHLSDRNFRIGFTPPPSRIYPE